MRFTMNMVDLAQRVHHPVKSFPTGGNDLPGMCSFLSFEPSSVRLSGFYVEGKDALMRIAQMDAKDVAAKIRFCKKPRVADCVDFEGRSLKRRISSKNKEVFLKLRPWEIVTLRIKGMVR